MRFRIFALTIRMLVAMHVVAGDDASVPQPQMLDWVLKGRVFDEQNRPVAEVDVTTYWSANGITHNQVKNIEKDKGEHPEFSRNEGKMEAWGLNPTKSDAKGNFSLPMQLVNYHVLAIDKQRTRGALVTVNPQRPLDQVDLNLQPLVRLHGTLKLPANSAPPKWTLVVARLPTSDYAPLGSNRVALCSSEKSTFEFLLPAGDYELEAAGEVSGKRYELLKLKPVKVRAGQFDGDAGSLTLEVPPPTQFDHIQEAKAKGEWAGVDRKQLLGKPAPKWHAVDVRGISKDAQISDFKGKWVLVYFWNTGCAGCLGRTIPRLIKFYEDHKSQRDKFELVAICLEEPEIKSMADLDRELKSVVKAVWGGKPLPFPTILDNTLITTENFGADQRGSFFLFDPDSRLVDGDHRTLAEKLGDKIQPAPKP